MREYYQLKRSIIRLLSWFHKKFLDGLFFLFLNDKNVIGSDIGVVAGVVADVVAGVVAGGTLKKLW